SMLFYHFFFSSRRRHTRSKRDWSSDVCSSDLVLTFEISSTSDPSVTADQLRAKYRATLRQLEGVPGVASVSLLGGSLPMTGDSEIGRASCRERVEIWGAEDGVKRKRVLSMVYV